MGFQRRETLYPISWSTTPLARELAKTPFRAASRAEDARNPESSRAPFVGTRPERESIKGAWPVSGAGAPVDFLSILVFRNEEQRRTRYLKGRAGRAE